MLKAPSIYIIQGAKWLTIITRTSCVDSVNEPNSDNFYSEINSWVYLPITYVVYRNKIIIHYLAAPKFKPNDAFLIQTEKRQQENGVKRKLIPLDQIPVVTEVDMAGMIFHSSRCGSTLLCNMLDSQANCFTVRESDIVNKVLTDKDLSDKTKQHLLNTILNDYVRYSSYLGVRCVIKFSSFCTLHLPYLLAQYPAVPWVYLYREPESVISSLIKKPPGWLSVDFIQTIFGLLKYQIPVEPSLQAALVLRHCLKQVVKCVVNHSDTCSLLQYKQLQFSIEKIMEIANHFGFDVDSNNLTDMLSCLKVNAKTGQSYRATENHTRSSELAQIKNDGWGDYEYLCRVN